MVEQIIRNEVLKELQRSPKDLQLKRFSDSNLADSLRKVFIWCLPPQKLAQKDGHTPLWLNGRAGHS